MCGDVTHIPSRSTAASLSSPCLAKRVRRKTHESLEEVLNVSPLNIGWQAAKVDSRCSHVCS